MLPTLHGDRLIGRVAPPFHRTDRRWRLEGVYADQVVPTEQTPDRKRPAFARMAG